jgi:hypothetical protein
MDERAGHLHADHRQFNGGGAEALLHVIRKVLPHVAIDREPEKGGLLGKQLDEPLKESNSLGQKRLSDNRTQNSFALID